MDRIKVINNLNVDSSKKEIQDWYDDLDAEGISIKIIDIKIESNLILIIYKHQYNINELNLDK